MKKAKQFLISLGIACLISVPIVHNAVQSWNNTQITFEELPSEVVMPSAEDIRKKAHEIIEAEEKRQELINAELERQEETEAIRSEAFEILEAYQVDVPAEIQIYCEEAEEEFNICAEFLEAVAWRESRFDEKAENRGCSGIMQISTKWHKDRMERLGVTDIYEAQGNIRVGADYLSELFAKYDGDTYQVLKAYNGDTSEGVSDYAIEICEISSALERVHGK